jgi:hypothetical protein
MVYLSGCLFVEFEFWNSEFVCENIHGEENNAKKQVTEVECDHKKGKPRSCQKKNIVVRLLVVHADIFQLMCDFPYSVSFYGMVHSGKRILYAFGWFAT